MRRTVLSYGLGADSTAILLMMLADPRAFGLREDLADLVAVHSVTGDEFPDSLAYVEHHVLPLLRARRVRLVQVARGGDLEGDGIVVLDDTRTPYRIHARGPWRLSENLAAAGTVPTVAKGTRTCSAKAKGFVLDSWAEGEFGTESFRRVIGYHFGELTRAKKDTALQQQRNAEAGRVICEPSYPLIEARMDRPQVEAYVLGRTGEPIRKSYCVMCCFSGVCASRENHEERLRMYPELAAEALLLEHRSMALNEHSSLYAKASLYGRLTEDERNGEILRAFDVALTDAPHAVYEVRRVYFPRRTDECRAQHGSTCRAPQWWCRHDRTEHCIRHHQAPAGGAGCGGGPQCIEPARKGAAWRSVRIVHTASRGTAEDLVREFAIGDGVRLERGALSGIERAHYQAPETSYPAAAAFLVAAPAGAVEKQRKGFEKAWTGVTGRRGPQHPLLRQLPPPPAGQQVLL
ncbi:hypothetical protein ACFV3E_40905 [Streptomyces sp. NPDC059718]